MYLAPGLYYWTPIQPGTDGGLIIGKAQKSGGQEVNGLVESGGEITSVWSYGKNWGTFFTSPDSSTNIFDDTSCAGSGCIGKTELKVWNTAWGQQTIPMGSAAGCNKTLFPACTADQINGIFVKSWTITGNEYVLIYDQVVPKVFPNYPYSLRLEGIVSLPPAVGKPRATLSVDFSTLNKPGQIIFTSACINSITCELTQLTGSLVTITNNAAYIAMYGGYQFRLTASNGKESHTSDAFVTLYTPPEPFQPSTNEGCSLGTSRDMGQEWLLILGFLAFLLFKRSLPRRVP